MKTEKLNVAVGQIIKMQDSDGTFDVIVTSTNAENYFLIQPIGAALMFKKVSYQGKAFKSKATVCK